LETGIVVTVSPVLFLLATVRARELITTLPSKSASTHSVIGIFSVCTHIVHNSLLLLWAEVVLALLDRITPVRAGTGKIVLAVFVCQPNDALTLSFCRTEIMCYGS
jgi:hypothetical protein